MHRQMTTLVVLCVCVINLNQSASAEQTPLSAAPREAIRSTPTVYPPSEITTLHINLSSVNISWSYPDTDPPTHFVVQVLIPSFNNTNFHNITSYLSDTYYVYNGLEYSVFYQFRVLAYRDGQLSEPSEASLLFDNGITAPPGPPQNLQLLAVHEDAILMTWTAPVPANELKYLYNVYSGEAEDQLQLIDSLHDSTFYTFNHLKPSTKYYFSVQADYGGERSILAPPVSLTFSQHIVLPLVNITSLTPNYTSVTIEWSEPVVSKSGAYLRGYTVFYAPLLSANATDDPLQFITKNVSKSQHSAVVSNLEQNTEYAFAVQYSIVGGSITVPLYSNESYISTVTTLSSLSCVSCHSVSSTQVSLSWKVLNNAHQAQTYIVTAVPEIQPTSFTTRESHGTQVVTGLHPWSKHEFKIRLDSGLYGSMVSTCPLYDCRTMEDKPSGFPANLAATTLNTTAINVSWSPVPLDQQNGVIEAYIVGCVPLCPATQYATSAQHYVVSGLSPWTEYTFVVSAMNKQGFGPDSDTVTARTEAEKLIYPPTNIELMHITHDYATLSWQPPKSTNRTGEVTLYTILYTISEDSDSSNAKPTGNLLKRSVPMESNYSINTTSTRVNLTNLTTGATYVVWVSAWTSKGRGPFSTPFTFHTHGADETGCVSCSLNITVDIVSLSRKCFAVTMNWLLYRVSDDVKFVYYNLTVVSSRRSIAYNRKLEDLNTTDLNIPSDVLDSDSDYTINLEAHLSLYGSHFFLQTNSSIKTPSCTGVTTVVIVVVSAVCIVLVLVSVGVVLLIFQKWRFKKRRARISSPTQMSRRFVVNNDYITLMKQQRGDGHSTNTGSLSTNSSGRASSPRSSSINEEDSGNENEHDPLLASRESPVFFVPVFSNPQPDTLTSPVTTPLHAPSEDLQHIIGYQVDEYIANSFPPLLHSKPSDHVPERPCPEGSSLSSVESLDQ